MILDTKADAQCDCDSDMSIRARPDGFIDPISLVLKSGDSGFLCISRVLGLLAIRLCDSDFH